jgi:Insertion element 4 transposase N-terminal/Transposase DDE domain
VTEPGSSKAPSRLTGRLTDYLSIGVLTATVPRFVVDEVIAATGRREKRSRLLPAHVVVYFVMALALFRDGYDEVIRSLVHGLQFARTWSKAWQVPTTGALSQARVRLGEQVMRDLFTRVARPLATPSTPGGWLGPWRLVAIDGVMLDIPDTAANLDVYQKAVGGTRRPYPQVKVVGLGECGTHAVLDAALGSIRHGERELASPLARSLEPNMLVMADRGFFSYELWRTYLLTGAQLLWRLTKTTYLPVLQVLPDGSYLSEIKSFRGPGRTRIPWDKVDDPMLATHIPVRVIEYQIDAGDGLTHLEEFRLITTILDPAEADAHELAACYTQRWEFESSLREIECQLLEPGATLRSKTPEMIRQEIWGLLLTHYAVRAFMTGAADTIEIDPDRLSTIRAINIVRRSVTDPAEFSPRSTR